jgi:transglutaminase-like putative cysteine protease
MRTLAKKFSQMLIPLFFSSQCLGASTTDGYKPSVTFQNNVITYTVKKNGSYRAEAERTILIETDQGVSNWGEEDITYIPKFSDVKILSAYTIRPDGTRVDVPQKNIHVTNDELDMGGSSYSDRKHKVLIFPNVEIGSRLYLKFIKNHKVPIFNNQFTFGSFVSPELRFEPLEFYFNFDKEMIVQIDSKGFDGGRLPDKNGMHRYHYIINQDKAIALEPDVISINDFAPHLLISTFNNNEELGKAYENKAKGKTRITPAIQKLADELTKDIDDKRKQVQLLYNWVSKNIRYVGSYLGNGGFVPHDSQTILDNKWGDCKDHVVILGALLAAKGVESSAALINTENSYALPAVATDSFDHVITYIPSLDLYLDSTAKFAPFGTLPDSDLDKPVVITALNKVGRTPPMLPSKDRTQVSIKLKVLPDGAIQASSHTEVTGDSEIMMRNRQFNVQNEPQVQVVNRMLGISDLTGVGEIHSSDPTDLDKPLVIDTVFIIDPVSNVPGHAAMPIPTGVAFGAIGGGMLSKPRDKLITPVKCDSFSNINHIEIEFPPNIKVTHIPDNVSYTDDSGYYTATYTLKGNRLEITRDLVSAHPTRVCGDEDNEMDKKFFPIFQRDMRAQVIYE